MADYATLAYCSRCHEETVHDVYVPNSWIDADPDYVCRYCGKVAE